MTFKREVVDLGNKVYCDSCGKEWTADMPGDGGFLFGSKAICPDCAPRYLEGVIAYGEQNHIKARQPKGQTFHAWVIGLSPGPRQIITTTAETKEDAEEMFRALGWKK